MDLKSKMRRRWILGLERGLDDPHGSMLPGQGIVLAQLHVALDAATDHERAQRQIHGWAAGGAGRGRRRRGGQRGVLVGELPHPSSAARRLGEQRESLSPVLYPERGVFAWGSGKFA